MGKEGRKRLSKLSVEQWVLSVFDCFDNFPNIFSLFHPSFISTVYTYIQSRFYRSPEVILGKFEVLPLVHRSFNRKPRFTRKFQPTLGAKYLLPTGPL